MNLINTTYNMQNSGSNRDTPIHFAPLSLVRAGGYYWSAGSLGYRGSYGLYWESKAYSNGYNAYHLSFDFTSLRPQRDNYSMGTGFSIRCTIR